MTAVKNPTNNVTPLKITKTGYFYTTDKNLM